MHFANHVGFYSSVAIFGGWFASAATVTSAGLAGAYPILVMGCGTIGAIIGLSVGGRAGSYGRAAMGAAIGSSIIALPLSLDHGGLAETLQAGRYAAAGFSFGGAAIIAAEGVVDTARACYRWMQTPAVAQQPASIELDNHLRGQEPLLVVGQVPGPGQVTLRNDHLVQVLSRVEANRGQLPGR